MTWRTSIAFVIFTTLITIAVGSLISADWLPIGKTIELGAGGLRFLLVWMNLAIAIGVVLPAIAFVIGFKHSKLRKVFGFYFLLLGIQIVTEQIFSQYWMPSLVVPIGTLYTAFRIWQLWGGLQLVHSDQKQLLRSKLSVGTLWLTFCFWISNLFLLLLLAWPNIFSLGLIAHNLARTFEI